MSRKPNAGGLPQVNHPLVEVDSCTQPHTGCWKASPAHLCEKPLQITDDRSSRKSVCGSGLQTVAQMAVQQGPTLWTQVDAAADSVVQPA